MPLTEVHDGWAATCSSDCPSQTTHITAPRISKADAHVLSHQWPWPRRPGRGPYYPQQAVIPLVPCITPCRLRSRLSRDHPLRNARSPASSPTPPLLSAPLLAHGFSWQRGLRLLPPLGVWFLDNVLRTSGLCAVSPGLTLANRNLPGSESSRLLLALLFFLFEFFFYFSIATPPFELCVYGAGP